MDIRQTLTLVESKTTKDKRQSRNSNKGVTLVPVLSPSLTLRLPRQKTSLICLYMWKILNDDYRYLSTEAKTSVFLIFNEFIF